MSILTLPNELLIQIAGYIHERIDATSILKTCRHLNTVLKPLLLQFLVKSEEYIIIPFYWGAATGNELLIREIVNFSTGIVFVRDDDEPDWLHHIPGRIEPSEALITRILKKGAKIKMQGHRGKTALDYATELGRPRMVELLLEVMDEKAGFRGRNKDRALDLAGLADSREITIQLFPTVHPHHRGDYLWTPLHTAVRLGHEESVKLLLEKGASTTAKERSGYTPFHFAAESGVEWAVRLFAKANPRAILQQSQSVVALARKNKHRSIVRFLLYEVFHHSDIDKVYGKTPLHMAAEDHDERLVIALLKKGASVTSKDNNGKTPLHLAAKYEHMMIIDLLIKNGADVSAKDDNGKTPLHIAARFGVSEVVAVLLREGADVNAQDRHGMTPLHIAIQEQDYGIRCSLVLLENGANVEIEDEWGRKPEVPSWFVDEFSRRDTSKWHETFLLLMNGCKDDFPMETDPIETDTVVLGDGST